MPLPKSYVGKNHETIGSDILSVLQVITMAESLLGAELAQKLRAVKPDQWYPIGLLLDSMELVAKKVGRTGLVQMGRNLFRLTHQEKFLSVATCVGDFAYGAHGMYLAANRGEGIGGWKLLAFEPGLAILENSTPHRCEMEEGIFAEAMVALKLPVTVKQTACVHDGAPNCIFQAS